MDEEDSRRSTSSIPLSDLEKFSVSGVNKTPENISKPEYKVDIPQSSKGSKKDPSSPTMSEMGYSVFSLKEEIIFSEKIQKSLNKSKNLEKRKWFLTCLNNKQRDLYTKRYDEWIRKTKSNLDFFLWLKIVIF